MQKTIETARLIIRQFVRDDSIVSLHRILDQEFGDAGSDRAIVNDLRSWLEWQVLSQEWFERMRQPPYGDRAIVLKASNQLIGVVGYVPCLAPFDQIPELPGASGPSGGYSTEFGLFYAIDPQFQRHGYATEAAREMLEYALKELRIKRVIAKTDYSNVASQNVMRRLGMKITRNPLPEPRWLQVVGVSGNR